MAHMDTGVFKTEDEVDYNKFGQKIINCKICGEPTTMVGTELCDRCWELETRIRMDIKLAEKILANLNRRER